MQVVKNEAYLRSRVKLINVTQITSLALLLSGFALALLAQYKVLGVEGIYAAYAVLIPSFLLVNYNRPLTRRFSPKFRQDELLREGLRGLDNQHTLFNFAAPELPDHVLVGPVGVYVLVPRPQSGTLRFNGQSWSRGSLAGTLLRGLGEGGLGSPTADARKALEKLAAYLQKNAPEDLVQGLSARAIIVFTHPGAQLEVRNLPSFASAVRARELKSIFRRSKPVLSPEKVQALQQVLGREV